MHAAAARRIVTNCTRAAPGAAFRDWIRDWTLPDGSGDRRFLNKNRDF
jgi:hypothetical protein